MSASAFQTAALCQKKHGSGPSDGVLSPLSFPLLQGGADSALVHPSASSPGRALMLRWFQALLPREDRFFELYNRHARTLVEGAEALRELLKGGPGITEAA